MGMLQDYEILAVDFCFMFFFWHRKNKSSDAWSSHRPSEPAYYIEDCQILKQWVKIFALLFNCWLLYNVVFFQCCCFFFEIEKYRSKNICSTQTWPFMNEVFRQWVKSFAVLRTVASPKSFFIAVPSAQCKY